MRIQFRKVACGLILGSLFSAGGVQATITIAGGAGSENFRFTDFANGDFSQNSDYLLDGYNLSGLPFDANGESYLAISDRHVLRGHQGAGNPLTFDIGGVLVQRTVASSVSISYSPTAGSNDTEITLMTLSAPITPPQTGDPVYDPSLFESLPILVTPDALNFVPPAAGSWPVTTFGGTQIGLGVDSGYGGVNVVVTGQQGRAGNETAEPYLAVTNAVAGTGNPYDFFGVTDTVSQTAGQGQVGFGDSDGGAVALVGATPVVSGGRIVGYTGGQLAAFGSANWVTGSVGDTELNGFTLPGYYLPQLTANGVSFSTLLAPESLSIPEPSRAVLIGLGVLAMSLRRRR